MMSSMLPKPDKIEDAVLLTHRGCLDGATCAILFLAAGGKEENIRYIAAGTLERFIRKDPLFSSDRFLMIVDLSLNSPECDDLLEKRGNLVLIDHHASSLHLVGRPWAEIEERNVRCGCKMFLGYLLDKFPERSYFMKSTSWRAFVDLVDAFDRWTEGNETAFRGGLELADLMTFFGQKEFVARFRDPKERVCWNMSRNNSKSFFNEFERQLLEALAKRQDELVDEVVRKAREWTLYLPDGSRVNVVYVVSADPHVSSILMKMSDMFPDAQAAMQVNVDRGQVSFRSDGRYDVQKLAAAFGGGGHAAASGHKLPADFHKTIMENIYE